MYIRIVIYELIIKLVEYINGIRTAQVIIHCFQYILNLEIFLQIHSKGGMVHGNIICYDKKGAGRNF